MSGDRALFVTGVEKSGKTPLRLLLDAQPWASLGRGRMWSRFYGRFGDLKDDRRLATCIATIAETDPDLDAGSLRQELDGAPGEMRTYAGLLGTISKQRAGRSGAPVWGEQAAEIEAFADEVMAAFPGAHILHLVRDPRDRFSESRQATRPGGLGQALALWRRSMDLAERNQQRYPDAYRVIRYEDFVAKPDKLLETIAGSVGQVAAPIEPGLVPDADSVGRFEQSLPAIAIAYLQANAAPQMERWGYRAAPLSLSLAERWRLRLVTGPVSDLRGRSHQGARWTS